MAQFNPKLPDDSINLNQASPLRELLILVGAVGAGAALLAILVGFTIDSLIPHIPIAVEQKIFSPIVDFMKRSSEDLAQEEVGKDVERKKLQQKKLEEILANLVKHWPESNYQYQIGIWDFGASPDEKPLPNAAAFPGGYILVTPSLLDGASSENEIAMVVGHELGHFRNRDHLRGLGKEVVFSLLLAAIGSSGTSQMVSTIAQYVGNLANRSFSRVQESQADAFGLSLVAAHYGHVGGTTSFFERMSAEETNSKMLLRYFRTHPLSQTRIDDLRTLASEHQWSFSQEVVGLPWEKKRSESLD